MTEKRQTSQGYIIRILQHFATKHRNITNFVTLFQAVMKFSSGLLAFIFWERHPRHRHAITKLSLFKGKLMRVEKREFA
jgi:hypothetical protein